MGISKESEKIHHESFGQIRFSRCSGHSNFYGSDLNHDHFITMEVNPSYIDRTLSQDWYFTKGLPLISIRMTNVQFAEAMTSLNSGSGIPCTIDMVDGRPLEALPHVEMREEFVKRKFKDRMVEFADKLKQNQERVKELTNKKGALTQAEKTELNWKIDWITQELTSNIPFFIKQFDEEMDNVVVETKSAMESSILHKIQMAGMQALFERGELGHVEMRSPQDAAIAVEEHLAPKQLTGKKNAKS